METSFSLAGRRIWVAGHRGMVGGAIMRRLASEQADLLTVNRADLDLRDQKAVTMWMERYAPDVVVLAAARVGGIAANDRFPASFISENLVIQSNIIDAAASLGVAKLLFLGSSCIYPRLATQPIKESALLSGPLEATNQWYAIAKIAGLKLCEAWRRQEGHDFISAMPTNLYGAGDNYDLESSHVLPALIRKAHEARLSGATDLTVWGSGKPRREFMHVDDLADALVFLLKHYSADEHINIGTGSDVTIAEAAAMVADVVGFQGKLVFDSSRPDGTPRKLMDSSKLAALGWSPRISLEAGLADAYAHFRASINP
jgi:GDP-L-fucose synthase